ncbi:MAG: ABC transporter permease, partial [Cyclobacteriaceae bacterium]
MELHRPPGWITKLMASLISKSLWECIEGDLQEIYDQDVSDHGRRKANRKYFFHALGFLRFRRLRNSHYSLRRLYSDKTQITMDLFSNYLKVSWRDLKRNKTFALINLTGLVAGFMACLLILQYVFYETGYDRFHENPEELYRVVNDRYQNGELVQHGMITYPLVGKALAEDFPEVTSHTRLTTGGRNYIRRDDQLFMVDDFLFADEHFLDIFNFPIKEGLAATALDEPFEVVLTATFAERFLKTGEKPADLIGQSVRIFTSGPACKISGILEDIPANSHLQFDLLISFKSMVSLSGGSANESWRWSDFYHYVRLKPGTDTEVMNEKLADFGDKYFKNGEVSGSVEKFYLQPLEDAHLYSDYEYEIGVVRNGKVVWAMLLTAIFLIVIAWVNFTNLSTSRATERAREVGVRKSLGASGLQLFWQFLAEAVLINGIALILAIVLVFILGEPYRSLTGLPLSFSDLLATTSGGIPYVLLMIPVFLLCLIIISIYPASVMSGYRTHDTLKGRSAGTRDAVGLRKGLVVFQFATALLLVTGTFTLNRQIAYMQNKDLGMDMENNLVLFGPSMA